MKIHLVNPSDVSFGTAVITPRWLYVIAAATPRAFGNPALTDETLERVDPLQIQKDDTVGISIHTGNALRDNFLVHVDEQGCALCFGGCPLAATIADGERRDAEVYLRHKLGHRVPVSVRVAPIKDSEDRVVGAVEVFSDISAKKNIERRAGELEGLAFRDALTGVPNRRYIGLRVQQAIQEVDEFGRSIGLLMIDVDNFKKVNDEHGHDAGDLVLKTVCQTLSHSLRPMDIVGRWGGDEFLLLTMDVGIESLASFAERCRTLIAESNVPFENRRIRVTASIGATLLQQGDSADSATKRADDSMYRSKRSGRSRTTVG